VQERYRDKKKELCMAFIDLEKAFGRVSRDVLRSALRVLEVEEWTIKIFQSMYEGLKISVRIDLGENEEFGVKVGVHQ